MAPPCEKNKACFFRVLVEPRRISFLCVATAFRLAPGSFILCHPPLTAIDGGRFFIFLFSAVFQKSSPQNSPRDPLFFLEG